jgi:signal transduction histidine kinase
MPYFYEERDARLGPVPETLVVPDTDGREREQDRVEGANATKSRFFAAAVHDLRQPLQSLGFYVSMLATESDPVSSRI